MDRNTGQEAQQGGALIIEPKIQLQLTEIENGWLVGKIPLTHPQTGQIIRPGTIEHGSTYEDICDILKKYFKSSVLE